MILNFSVTNYRIFRNRTTLSMEATKDRRLRENAFDVPGGRGAALKLSAVYGANASGKTTVFQALNLFIRFIRDSPSHTKDSVLNYLPFAFADAKEPTSFECEFVTKGVRYTYGFSYDRDAVREEHLYSYPNSRRTVVSERDGDSYTFRTDVRFRKENARRVGSKSLYVSVCAQFNDRECMNVFEWATKEVTVMIDYDRLHSLDVLTSLMKSDKEFNTLAVRSFGIADLGITNVRDKGKDTVPSKDGTIVLPVQDIWVRHRYNGVDRELPVALESAGTVRFLSVIGPVIDALRKGTTIVVDEIDMSFHTDLCRWITGLFLDPSENRSNAQLILNTHDVSLLDQSVLRRDQVYFSIKDGKSGEGELRRLSDYGVRNDLDIRKAYLNGSFGARPFIAPDKLMENEE